MSKLKKEIIDRESLLPSTVALMYLSDGVLDGVL